MYGSEIGSLNVYIKTSGSEIKVWSQTGNIGDQWMYGQVPINEKRQFRVRRYLKLTLITAYKIYTLAMPVRVKLATIPEWFLRGKCHENFYVF